MMGKFPIGAPVRVRVAFPVGHNRTPGYIRGKRGVIERLCGEFRNPEELAYGRSGALEPMYRVRFALSEVWPAKDAAARDTIDVELYEHWLEPA